ncbi:MAG: PBP1A family penicillin-binding protein [SAR86 cluster bacterium]|nr:PBP1A family penicillin-binding protein [SAR86 cluster bacterium]
MKIKTLILKFWLLTKYSLILFLFGLSGLILYVDPKLPDETEIKRIQLQVPLKIYTEDKKLIGEFGEKRRSALIFTDIHPLLVKSFIAAEDSNFFDHGGVDFKGLARAFYQLLSSGKIVGGGSTITMQVAGNYLTGRDVNFYRKIKDIFMAYKLENEYSKEEIFEFYVNRIFLGNRAYGIAAASEVYYGKSVSDLNLAQFAMIASLPKAPSRVNPISNPARALSRRNYVLKRMLELEFILEDQFNLAFRAPISATYHGLVSEVSAPYVAENLRRYMVSEYGLAVYREGYEVYTTISSSLQKSANKALKQGLETYDYRHGFREPENVKIDFPEGFFILELKERIDYLNKISDQYILKNNYEDNFINRLKYSLEDKKATKYKFPAVAINVGKHLTLMAENGEIYKIPWSDNLSWARPYISPDRRGLKPKSYNDIVNEGDILWISVSEITGVLSLSQIPEVQGALVALDPKDGAVKALVGGYDFNLSKYDRATQSAPLLGSNFKPFLYAAALNYNFMPSSIINDAPVVFEDEELEEKWRPRNASGNFYGPTRLREGLVQSRNLVSIRLLREIGVEKVKNYVTKFGFKKDRMPSDLSLALGTASMSPLDNAAAYSVLANGGKKIEPYFISKVVDSRGRIIYEREKIIEKEEPDIDPRITFILKDILQEAAYRGTGKKIRSLNRSDFSAKTGTTNDAESTWFTGFNDHIVTTVWVGFDTPKSLGNREFGSTTALPIWLDFMTPIIQEIPLNNSLPPNGLVSIKVDKKSGIRASEISKSSYFEYFLQETTPN